KDEVPFEVGIALHFGEVAYGNVGSGARLDYTVIGRDVNLGARIAGLCAPLERRLLVSAAFKSHLQATNFVSLGSHELKGLPEEEEIFASRS
ncbi:MAG: adenylate/guanylate cyclase domain-containing protein, partial [Geminicoccaceae bacterium]